MTPTNQHIIARQVLDLNLFSNENNFDLQRRMSKYFWAQITPVLDGIFDKYAGADEVVLIDKLELDLGEIDLENLETAFVERLKAELEETLTKKLVIEQTTAQKQSKNQHYFAQWLQFLETGTLAWSVEKLNAISREAVLETVKNSWIAAKQLQQILVKNPQALTRLIYQHEDEFLTAIIVIFIKHPQRNLLKTKEQSIKWLTILKSDAFIFKNENEVYKRVYADFKQELKRVGDARLLFWKMVLMEAIVDKNKVEPPILGTRFFQHFLAKQQSFVFFKIMAVSILKKEELTEIAPVLQAVFIKKMGKKSFSEWRKKVLANPSDISFEKWEKSFEKSLKKQSEKAKKTDSSKALATDISLKNEANTTENSTAKSDKKAASSQETFTSNVTSKNKANKKAPVENILNKSNMDAKKETISTAAPDERTVKQKSSLDATPQTIKNGSAWYLNNAGIALLHVFLPMLFRKLELADEANFKNEETRQRAVHLIQFLATGKEALPEYELLLSKLLCGVPFEHPIAQNLTLTIDEKTAGNDLLKAVITHWKALGNSSPDALREGFLQREGKLEKRENGWHLTVEKKTLDILLNQLPWNIGMVKLPWMKEILWVDWH